jgi:hypothetical protein
MTAEPVFDAVVEPARNLAQVRFAGDFTGAAMEAAATKVESILPQLKPGFRVLADFSRVIAMDLDCVAPLARVMDLCRAHNVGLIVRILPAKEHDIGINLLSIVHYRGLVRTVTVDNMAEAERVLA